MRHTRTLPLLVLMVCSWSVPAFAQPIEVALGFTGVGIAHGGDFWGGLHPYERRWPRLSVILFLFYPIGFRASVGVAVPLGGR